MNTLICFVYILPSLFLFNPDMGSDALGSSFDAFPFYLEYNNISSLLFKDDADNLSDFVYDDMLSRRTLFYDNYHLAITVPVMNRTFAIDKNMHELHYGGGIVNSTAENRVYYSQIYGSLVYRDDIYRVRALSYMSIEENAPYNYKNSINIVYRNMLFKTEIDRDNYSVMGGYYCDSFFAAAGYGKNRLIPVLFSLNMRSFNVFGDMQYYMDSKTFAGDITAAYYMHMDRFLIMPILHFNDSLSAGGGLSYRMTPEITNYINYIYNSNTFSAGIRGDNALVMCNVNAAYDIRNSRFIYDLSLTGESPIFVMNCQLHYDTLISWDANVQLKGQLFSGNLIPGAYISYKNNNDLYCALTVKLIDAEIFGGAMFYLNEEKYMIKGGFKWYFSEKTQY